MTIQDPKIYSSTKHEVYCALEKTVANMKYISACVSRESETDTR